MCEMQHSTFLSISAVFYKSGLLFFVLCLLVRRPSCYSCIRVNTIKTNSDAVIAKLSKILEESGPQNAIEEKGMSKNGEVGVSVVEKHRSILEDTSIGQNSDINSIKAFEVSESLVLFKANGQTGPIFKCQLPGLDYVVFVRGSGPHAIEYDFMQDKPPKEVIVSRKCAESVLRGAQVHHQDTSTDYFFRVHATWLFIYSYCYISCLCDIC